MIFRIGRVFKIPIEIHIGWLLIFAALAYSIGIVYIGQADPHMPRLLALGVGTVTALALFICLFAHELAHCIVASRFGIKTERITFFMLGGIARMEEEPKTAAEELRVALAGPIASIMCAGAFGLVWLGLDTESTWAMALFYLVYANTVMGAANMLPGLPLDGGRVLRSLIWKITGNRSQATIISGGAGIALGLGLAGMGSIMMLMSGDLSGIWLIMIGWFINNAASITLAEESSPSPTSGREEAPFPVTWRLSPAAQHLKKRLHSRHELRRVVYGKVRL